MAFGSLLPWRRQERPLATRGGDDPFAMLQREMNEFFDSFFGAADLPAELGVFAPRIDLEEDDTELRVTAELPGVEETDVEVTLADDVLTIKGDKKSEREEKSAGQRVRMERTYGAFRRSIALPCDVQADRVTASFKNGVLTVALPKAEAARKAHKIAVTAG